MLLLLLLASCEPNPPPGTVVVNYADPASMLAHVQEVARSVGLTVFPPDEEMNAACQGIGSPSAVAYVAEQRVLLCVPVKPLTAAEASTLCSSRKLRLFLHDVQARKVYCLRPRQQGA